MTSKSAIPSTTKSPSKISELDRASNEATSLDIRDSYKSRMVSKGKHLSYAVKNQAAKVLLEEHLRSIAEAEASFRAERYQILQMS